MAYTPDKPSTRPVPDLPERVRRLGALSHEAVQLAEAGKIDMDSTLTALAGAVSALDRLQIDLTAIATAHARGVAEGRKQQGSDNLSTGILVGLLLGWCLFTLFASGAHP